jgi:hypothetical protein
LERMQQDIQLASDLWKALHHWAYTADIPAAADFQKMAKTIAVNKQGLQLDTAPAISLRLSKVRFGGISVYMIRKKEIDSMVIKRSEYFAIQVKTVVLLALCCGVWMWSFVCAKDP